MPRVLQKLIQLAGLIRIKVPAGPQSYKLQRGHLEGLNRTIAFDVIGALADFFSLAAATSAASSNFGKYDKKGFWQILRSRFFCNTLLGPQVRICLELKAVK
jgi:hypothetical protein